MMMDIDGTEVPDYFEKSSVVCAMFSAASNGEGVVAESGRKSAE